MSEPPNCVELRPYQVAAKKAILDALAHRPHAKTEKPKHRNARRAKPAEPAGQTN